LFNVTSQWVYASHTANILHNYSRAVITLTNP
jgi:hypothetical protein